MENKRLLGWGMQSGWHSRPSASSENHPNRCRIILDLWVSMNFPSWVVSKIRNKALDARGLIAAYPKSQVDILLKQKKDVSRYVNLFLGRLDRA